MPAMEARIPGPSGLAAKEKDIALKIALELGKTIQKYLKDVKVIYTRNDDTFIELEERAQIANKNGADLFISIHCNSLPANTSESRKQSVLARRHISWGCTLLMQILMWPNVRIRSS
jgi:N-acetylmuramoyl-L-alanine amidase